ncbi:MAG: hypothetical protein M3O36_02770, partial [Myxococcota bacterium]|nr:hypothetical protein [Myxococcota bacterium]
MWSTAFKDMLIRGGENIHCIEIEDQLARHPCVSEAAVFGLPDPALGEVVGAVLRPRPATEIDAEDVMSFVSQRLPPHKVPVAIWVWRDDFPRNAAGKVLKRELRKFVCARELDTLPPLPAGGGRPPRPADADRA